MNWQTEFKRIVEQNERVLFCTADNWLEAEARKIAIEAGRSCSFNLESGLHYTVYAEHIRDLMRTPWVASTQSWEFIVTAHQVLGDNLKYVRIERRANGEVYVVEFDTETLGASIEYGFEVR